jgi:HEPN domain-containing protein
MYSFPPFYELAELSMNDSVREWVEKAEGDFSTALRECRVRKNRNHDAVCFHAQQCVEKYLKAVLCQHGIAFAKTHDLAVLLKACLPKYPLWSANRDDMERLSQYAVGSRYPGESCTLEKSKRAVAAMKRKRFEVRGALGLPC